MCISDRLLNNGLNKKILNNINNIASLLSEMMDLARFNYQDYKLNKIELVSLIETLVSEFEDLGMNVSFLHTPRRINILANTHLLNIAFSNLINNAVKYGKKAIISLTLNHEKVVVNIDDLGEGLDYDDINKIFEPFYRAKKHSNIQGHGLGLSMAKSIIEKHKATIICIPNNSSGGLRMQISLQVLVA